jgi:hypothetical protein
MAAAVKSTRRLAESCLRIEDFLQHGARMLLSVARPNLKGGQYGEIHGSAPASGSDGIDGIRSLLVSSGISSHIDFRGFKGRVLPKVSGIKVR